MSVRPVILASAAAPAAVAIGYVVLTGYLLSRVRPLPISVLPGAAADDLEEMREFAQSKSPGLD